MRKIINKITASILCLSIIAPQGVFAAGAQESEREIARMITSQEKSSDAGSRNEIALSIAGAFFVAEAELDLRALVTKGQTEAFKEMQQMFYKWADIIPEYPNRYEVAFKNAKENLLAKYKGQLDSMWDKKVLSVAERENRVVLESKVFALERILFVKQRNTLVIDTSLKNPRIISELSHSILGREFVEQVSLDMARSIDITGAHSYMGFNLNNVRETVIGFLNNIVENRYKEKTALTKTALEEAGQATDRTVQLLRIAMSAEKGKESFRVFLRALEHKLPQNGGILGIGAGLVIGGGLLFAASAQAGAQNISNSRVTVTRELKSTAQNAPWLLSTKIIALRNTYGAKLVSSVIYENQGLLLSTAQKQFACMAQPKVQAEAAQIIAQLGGQQDAAANKASLKKAVSSKKAENPFMESLRLGLPNAHWHGK